MNDEKGKSRDAALKPSDGAGRCSHHHHHQQQQQQ